VLEKPRQFARHWSQRIDARLDAVAALPPPPVFLSIEKSLAVSVPVQVSVCISVGVHLFVILFVGFSLFDPNQFTPPHNVMDVVLVNAKSQSRPTKADALAQANLDGGGNTDEKRRAKSPLPAMDQQAAMNARQAEDRVKQMEQELKTLMTQAKSAGKVVQGELNQRPSGSPDPLSAAELLQKSIEIERLEAQISLQYEAYQQRPKRKFIGARVTESRFAHYVDAWRAKVERVGNLNYPEEAKTRRIHGSLQLTVSIKADGEIEDVQINRSSGYKILDDAAKRIVRLAAPFDRFPENIRRDTDILHITRTWLFTKSDLLSAE